MPATTQGFTAELIGTIRSRLRGRVESVFSLFGYSAPRWMAQETVTQIVDLMAFESAEIQEAIAAAVGNYIWNDASGSRLIDLGELLRVEYDYGAYSTVTLTVGAWDQGAVTLPAGSKAEDVDTGITWITLSAVTIPADGTATVEARSEDKGPFTAEAYKITRKVQGAAGWTSVTNTAPAVTGRGAADWATYRNQIAGRNYSVAARSLNALKDRIENLTNVTYCYPYQNPSFDSETLGGVEIPGYWLALWVAGTLTDTDKLTIAEILHNFKDASVNVKHVDTSDSTGFVVGFRNTHGQPRTVGAYYVQNAAIKVRVTVSDFEDGYGDVGDVEEVVSDAITAAVEAYFETLSPGKSKVRQNDILGAVSASEGVGFATVELSVQNNPGTDPSGDSYTAYAETDVSIDRVQQPFLYEVVVQ